MGLNFNPSYPHFKAFGTELATYIFENQKDNLLK
jgi:hypothetical protein